VSPASQDRGITDPSSTAPLPKSAAQHVFVQQRTFRMRNFVILAALGLAVLLIAGVGYLKYRSLQRLKIENAVVGSLKNAPSPTLRAAHVSVSVLDTGEVILGGNVPSSGDSAAASLLAASVPGVARVNNQLQVVQPPPTNLPGAESSDALVSKGKAFMDAGDYPAAIDCFTRAANDPNNKSARELVDLARRAQKTEEELLKKRR
jgi:hypothetical protein